MAVRATLAAAAVVAVTLPAAAATQAVAATPAAAPRVRATVARHIAIALSPRDPAALAAYALAVSTPGSADYRHYLTTTEFRRRFGAAPSEVAAVRAALRAHGLGAGRVSEGALSIELSASAAQLRRAFGTAAVAGSRAVSATMARATLGSAASAAIQAIVGLGTAPGPRPLLVRPDHARIRTALSRAHVATGGPQPCAAAQQAAAAQSAYTADQIASVYGFSGLYAAHDLGAGVTVAVYELEGDDPADIAAFQSCYGTAAQISYVSVDGGAGPGPGSGEAALDIENLISLAPDATVLVYQGPNSNSGSPGSGPYDTFSAIINQDRARVVTVSWGECEPILGQAAANAESTLFEQAAVQGQTIIAASGDSGSEDCYDPTASFPRDYAAVDDPSSQPFVTGVGGTSLTQLGARPTETVWNGGGNAQSLASQPGAAGGGVSMFWPMPPAQSQAATSLGVRNPLANGTECGNPGGLCREVPDVSANADPATGYLVYFNGAGTVAGQPTGWQALGGTSGAAPLWAAVVALADASGSCAQSGVGYADPALYRAAGANYAGDFNDVTTGNNDYTGADGGLFPALPGYDLATGLGTPQAAPLAAALCGDGIGLSDPGSQRSTLGARVVLTVHATDVPGSAVVYSASGLPRGLRIDAATGRISGRPRSTGTSAVRVVARDNAHATASASFAWTIGGPPRIFGVSLTSGPALAFTVTAGRAAPPLSGLTLELPPGLRIRSRRGISAEIAGSARRLAFSDRALGPRTLVVSLSAPATRVRLTLGRPSLTQVGHLRARERLSVLVTDTGAGATRLLARLAGAR
ncbi:MAG: protease pro-enzyme activation domain-containing protein [Solirubrobacteraceae bacterium]